MNIEDFEVGLTITEDKVKDIISKGVQKGLMKLVGLFLLSQLIVIGVMYIRNPNIFSYDSIDGETRSGMVIKTDALSGCQYLVTGTIMGGSTGIIPRMVGVGKDRKQMGCKEN